MYNNLIWFVVALWITLSVSAVLGWRTSEKTSTKILYTMMACAIGLPVTMIYLFG